MTAPITTLSEADLALINQIHGHLCPMVLLGARTAIMARLLVIGDGAVIASGCVLLEGMEVPPGKLVIGVPGRVVGDVRPEQREFWEWGTRLYQGLPARCHAALRRIEP